jgi:hypothetical protein
MFINPRACVKSEPGGKETELGRSRVIFHSISVSGRVVTEPLRNRIELLAQFLRFEQKYLRKNEAASAVQELRGQRRPKEQNLREPAGTLVKLGQNSVGTLFA